ncbi:2,3-bisphosphoglycerate-independent phosphoglycerate mutase [Candidatus Uhrbacteria bacterium]|nr:2,3-bisphosphoglycerate-independent phosphoglycerate mutase [Candidatus Uhrbacteria bacterium]
MSTRLKPVVLMILDGFGIAPPGNGNAITRAKLPVYNRLIRTYPAVTLRASGDEVGLSWGEMGNSEVGHLTIGAGRVFYQTLPRINKSIESGDFFKNEAFGRAIRQVKKEGATLHLIGLVSPGGVHSHQDHLYKLLELAKKEKVKNVAVHAILDGRDTIRDTGAQFIEALRKKMKEFKIGVIASISGRYFAMDRDNRWDRTGKAYRAMVGNGERGTGNVATAEDPKKAIEQSYKEKVYDEEFVPTVIVEKDKPVAPISGSDAVIFFNFREDRMRQLVKAFALPTFDKFDRGAFPKDALFVTVTEYEKDLPVIVAFPPEIITTCLAKLISDAKLKQFHIAETEKYAHVTFFFNGMTEAAFSGEDREIIPSPKVAAYDKKPEMSAKAVADRVIKEIQSGKPDFIALNFANPDMVAHTGDLKATIAGLEAVDAEVGRIVEATLAKGGMALLTADHGNAEELVNLQTGKMDKEHSTNPVPCVVIGAAYEGQGGPQIEAVGGDLSLLQPVGTLSDVAPTVLKLMGLKKPREMTGVPLV